jgi:hypothetical protein
MNQTARRALFVFVLGSGTLLTLSQVWGQLPAPAPAGGGHSNDQLPAAEPRAARLPDLQPPAEPGAAEPADPPAAPDVPEPPAAFGGSFGVGVGRAGLGGFNLRGRHHNHARSEAEIKELEALRQAIGKLKSAKNETEKATLSKQISQLLDKSFERDMQRREKQISDVEARVKKLRDQIEKRKKAKDDIVSLRLKTIVNEADGLGFPEGVDAEAGFSWQPDPFNHHMRPMPFNPLAPKEADDAAPESR